MKNLSSLFVLAAIVLASGCGKLKEKRFSTTIHHAFEVDIQQDGELTIDLNNTITSLINEELEKVKDKIKRYELVNIRYKIWEFYGEEPNLFDGSIGIGNMNSNTPGVTINLTDVDLRAGNDNPNLVIINLNSLDKSRVEQYFMDTNGLRLFLNGSVDQKPVRFKIQVTVDIDAIAEVKKR